MNAPVVLFSHGYPCSSYEFRDDMRHPGEDWQLLARDFPGSGYSVTPETFGARRYEKPKQNSTVLACWRNVLCCTD